MDNLYHKVAVTSLCTALTFTLVTNKEAKAATFNLSGTSFSITEGSFYVERGSVEGGTSTGLPSRHPETRAFYEFDIGNLSLAPNTSIKSAILNTPFINLRNIAYRFLYLDLYGYVGNGRPDLSDFNAGVNIAQEIATLYSPYPYYPRFGEIKFDVTNFVKARVSNGDAFAGLGIRVGTLNFTSYPNAGSVDLRNYYGDGPTLTIETVPEPTTIFGSALALGVGGWLKRKKSSQQNKTTPQN